MASTPKDIVVTDHTPMPRRYIFLPKGDPYKTMNCRKKARAEGHEVYIVHDSKNRQLGIRVPISVYDSVQEKYEQTRKSRAEAVQKKDKKIEADLRTSIMSQFPKMPVSELPALLKHALMKHSGKVGRTGTLDLAKKANLAVRAHIRHRHTDYHKLLADKISRGDARVQISKKVDDIAVEWGYKSKPGKWKDERSGDIPDIEKKTRHKANSNHKPRNRCRESSSKEKRRMKRRASVVAAISIRNKILAENAAKVLPAGCTTMSSLRAGDEITQG
ncbi:hypothetical protein F5Y06DRAFT_275441 [Hypoxylon sp. FL0890]|nr:hypothetical protein F5Y06DRAFT_275441 [Hypoxylon sp. FL0890]